MECDSEPWTVVKGRSEGKNVVASFSNHNRKTNTPIASQKAFKLRTRNGDNWVIGSDSKSADIERESNGDGTPATDKTTNSRVSSSLTKKEKPDSDYSDKIGASFKTFVVRQTTDFSNTSNHPTSSFGTNVATHTHNNPPESRQRTEHTKREDGLRQGARGLLRINALSLNDKVPPFESSKGGRDLNENIPDINFASEADWPSIALPEGSRDAVEGTAMNPGSWSKVVKAPAPPRVVLKHPADDQPPVVDSNSADEGEQDGKGKRKKRKKKKKGSGQPAVPNERRVDQPVMLELGSMFERLEVKKSKKIVLATGAPVVANLNTPLPKPSTKETASQRSGNLLDSSAPVVRRGKERETPKKKHPSTLRKVITKEKEEKKKLMGEQQSAVTAPPPSATEDGDQLLDVEEPIPRKPHPPAGTNKCTVHSKRFREYCSHVVKDEINDCTTQLLTDLVRFQDRQYQKDPIKAKAKRRYVCGLREVTKHLKLRKLKCVIVPPNLDKIQSTGGIDDAVDQILVECIEQQVPVVFAMSRRRLAFVLKKNHKIGCVGIFSYDGAEAHYKRLMQLVSDAKEEYQLKIAALKETSSTDQQPLYILQTNLDISSDISKTDPTKTTGEQQVTEFLNSDSDSESEDSGVCSGNGTQTNQQSLLNTPWRIFFQNGHTPRTHGSDASNLIPHTAATTTTPDANNSCTHDSEIAGLVEFETGQTSTACVSLQNGDSSLNFRPLNVHANAFVPPFQFSWNINAQEFVPNDV